MRRRFALATLAGVAVMTLIACGGDAEPPSEETPVDEPAIEIGPQADEPEEEQAEEPAPQAEELTRVQVVVYFPSAGSNDLTGESRTIIYTASPVDRAKQILVALARGPQGRGGLPALPEGTIVRQVYFLDHGELWVDFSNPLLAGTPKGSSGELLTVYAIVNSLAINLKEVRKVGLLVDGQPLDTLGGHIDLRRALPARRDLSR